MEIFFTLGNIYVLKEISDRITILRANADGRFHIHRTAPTGFHEFVSERHTAYSFLWIYLGH